MRRYLCLVLVISVAIATSLLSYWVLRPRPWTFKAFCAKAEGAVLTVDACTRCETVSRRAPFACPIVMRLSNMRDEALLIPWQRGGFFGALQGPDGKSVPAIPGAIGALRDEEYLKVHEFFYSVPPILDPRSCMMPEEVDDQGFDLMQAFRIQGPGVYHLSVWVYLGGTTERNELRKLCIDDIPIYVDDFRRKVNW